jgi:TrkA domain protein
VLVVIGTVDGIAGVGQIVANGDISGPADQA